LTWRQHADARAPLHTPSPSWLERLVSRSWIRCDVRAAVFTAACGTLAPTLPKLIMHAKCHDNTLHRCECSSNRIRPTRLPYPFLRFLSRSGVQRCGQVAIFGTHIGLIATRPWPLNSPEASFQRSRTISSSPRARTARGPSGWHPSSFQSERASSHSGPRGLLETSQTPSG